MSETYNISEQLSAWLDGELGEAQAAEVERAVQADASLAAQAEQLRSVRQLVMGLPRVEAPADFVSNVLARTERLHLVTAGEASDGHWPRMARWTALAAMIAIAVSVAVVIVGTLTRVSQYNHTPVAGNSPASAVVAPAIRLARADQSVRDVANDLENKGEAGMTLYSPDVAAMQRKVESALQDNGYRRLREGESGSGFTAKTESDYVEINVTAEQLESALLAMDDIRGSAPAVAGAPGVIIAYGADGNYPYCSPNDSQTQPTTRVAPAASAPAPSPAVNHTASAATTGHLAIILRQSNPRVSATSLFAPPTSRPN